MQKKKGLFRNLLCTKGSFATILKNRYLIAESEGSIIDDEVLLRFCELVDQIMMNSN